MGGVLSRGGYSLITNIDYGGSNDSFKVIRSFQIDLYISDLSTHPIYLSRSLLCKSIGKQMARFAKRYKWARVSIQRLVIPMAEYYRRIFDCPRYLNLSILIYLIYSILLVELILSLLSKELWIEMLRDGQQIGYRILSLKPSRNYKRLSLKEENGLTRISNHYWANHQTKQTCILLR